MTPDETRTHASLKILSLRSPLIHCPIILLLMRHLDSSAQLLRHVSLIPFAATSIFRGRGMYEYCNFGVSNPKQVAKIRNDLMLG